MPDRLVPVTGYQAGILGAVGHPLDGDPRQATAATIAKLGRTNLSNVKRALRVLVARGYADWHPHPGLAGLDYWAITDTGRAYLRHAFPSLYASEDPE